MRLLKYNKPCRLKQTTIEKGMYLYENKPLYFEKFSTVCTKKGLVIIYQIDWATNSLPVKLTIFKTVINGFVYEAELSEQKLSDKQLKWLATNFINTVIKNDRY